MLRPAGGPQLRLITEPPVKDAWVAQMATGYRLWLANVQAHKADPSLPDPGPDPFEVMVAETEAKMIAEDRADALAALAHREDVMAA